MSSINSISTERLALLIGTPKCPVLVDVRTDEDFASLPHLVPGSVRRPYVYVADWAGQLSGQSAIIFCQKGLKLSEGVAAWLRFVGTPADILEGGVLNWRKAGMPMINTSK